MVNIYNYSTLYLVILITLSFSAILFNYPLQTGDKKISRNYFKTDKEIKT